MQCSQKVDQKKWSHNSSRKTSRTSTPTPPLPKGLLMMAKKFLKHNLLAENLRHGVLEAWSHFGIRSGSVWGPFGPISDQNFPSQKFKILKNQFGRPSPLQQGPRSPRPEPRRPEGPRRSSDGRRNQFFLIWNFWLRKFWSEIGPNGPRTDPEPTPNEPKIWKKRRKTHINYWDLTLILHCATQC